MTATRRAGRRAGTAAEACDACLARSALLARLAGPLDRAGPELSTLLATGDAELIAAVAGARADAVSREHAAV